MISINYWVTKTDSDYVFDIVNIVLLLLSGGGSSKPYAFVSARAGYQLLLEELNTCSSSTSGRSRCTGCRHA
jgi:hypothetical protein